MNFLKLWDIQFIEKMLEHRFSCQVSTELNITLFILSGKLIELYNMLKLGNSFCKIN